VTTKFSFLPDTNESDNNVVTVSSVEDLGDKVKVGDQGSLKNDGGVGSVEQLNGVRLSNTSHLVADKGNIDSPALHVDNDEEDEDGSKEVVKIGRSRSVESQIEGI
jgi:hypothetical protein